MNHPPTSFRGNSSPKETGIHFPCPQCSLGFSSSSGLKRHLAGHQRNPTAHLAHLVNANGFRCNICGTVFNSQIGLSQHRRRSHPVEYNEEKLARRATSQYNWSTLEDASLKRMASNLFRPGEAKKVLYTRLASLFPTRSAEAIKKRLQHLSWNPSNPNESTLNFPAPTSSNPDSRNQPQSSTGTLIITAPATCLHTDQSTSDSTVPLHEVQQYVDELADSFQNASSQATDSNVLFPSQRLRQPLSIRTLDNTTYSSNFPHSPTAVLTPLPVGSNAVDNHSNPDNPCDPSPINPVYTHYVASHASIAPSDTDYRQPSQTMPPNSPETHGPCDITKRHAHQTLSPTCPISQSLSPTAHECLLLETLPHTQTLHLTSSPSNISPTYSCPTLPTNALDSSNQCSPPLSSPQARTLPLTIINPTETHSTDNLSNSPLHNPTQISLVQDDVPQFATRQIDATSSQSVTATSTPFLTYHSSTLPHKKQSSLSRVAAKTSNRGNRRASDQPTLTSLWGAHRASQHETSTFQQAANVSIPAHTEQLQQSNLNADRISESSLSSKTRTPTQSPTSITNPVVAGQAIISAASQHSYDEAPAVEDGGSQPAIFLNMALHLSPALADVVYPTQSPLTFDSPLVESEPNSMNERPLFPAWLANDTTLQNLFCTVREQIKDCPANDPLIELKSLLDGGALISLDTFRTALEEFCNKRFPATWTPTKRRCRRRTTYHNNRQLRRIQFGHIQNLYKRRRKDAASTILDGRWRNAHIENDFKFPGFNDYWTQLLRGEKIIDPRPSRSLLPSNDALVAPIAPVDVSRVLNEMQGSAPGPDRVTPADLCRYRPASLSALLNCFLLSGILPKALNIARITFVPKTAIPTSPSDFRPISISSAVTRCFHKILFDRWCRSFPLDRQQFGFLRRDGCFELSSILHSSIRYSHSSCKSLSFANIDISKAFDHISHDSLLRAASSYGAPPVLLSYLRNVYSTGVSFFDNFSFSPLRGVRQGDPLSPLLFIMSLDEALTNSYDPLLTFHTPGGELDYLAYADDVILFAGSREALSIRLERLQTELRDIGLSINLGKTFCTHIVADGRRKTTMLADQPTTIASNAIPSSSVLSSWKVLGIPFNWKGKLPTTAKQDACSMLRELSQAPLKPQQRVDILRTHLIPRLIHQLTLGVVHKKTLKAIDLAVKSSLRKWLRLPNDVSNAFFHAAINDGGLGIPHLQSRIPLNRKSRLDRHLASQNSLLHWALREPSSQPFHRLALHTTVIGGEVVTSKEQAEVAWRNSLWKTLDGAGLRDTPTIPQSHNWLRHPEKLRPSTFIRAIKLRAGVLPTKSRRSRGRPSTNPQLTCRCGTAIESISHLLQTCPITHDARCRRHNDVVNSIARTLRRKGTSFLVEPHVPFASSYLKPDLIVFKGNCVFIADIAICDPHRMNTTLKLKKEKYGSPGAIKAISDFLRGWNRQFTKIVQAPIVFNNRGFVHPNSFHPLTSMSISKSQISDLCLLCVCGSLRTYDTYMHGCSILSV